MQPGFPQGQGYDVSVQGDSTAPSRRLTGSTTTLVLTVAVTASLDGAGAFHGTGVGSPVESGAALSALLTTNNNTAFTAALWDTPLFQASAASAGVSLVAPPSFHTSSTSSQNADPAPPATSGVSTATIIGAAVGGGCGLILIIVVVVCCCVRKSGKDKAIAATSASGEVVLEEKEVVYVADPGAPRRPSVTRVVRQSVDGSVAKSQV